MLSTISSAELTEWMAFYKMSPFGEARGDLRVAQLTALMANVHRDREKRPQPFEPVDFMPYAERPKKTNLFKRIKAAFHV